MRIISTGTRIMEASTENLVLMLASVVRRLEDLRALLAMTATTEPQTRADVEAAIVRAEADKHRLEDALRRACG